MKSSECVQCYEELLEGHVDVVEHQCLQADLQGHLKDIVRLGKNVYRNKEKVAFVFHISESNSSSKLAFSFLWKQDEETYF